MQIDSLLTVAACIAAAELLLGASLVVPRAVAAVVRRVRDGGGASTEQGDGGLRGDDGGDDRAAKLGVLSTRLVVVTAAALPVLYLTLLRAVETTPGVMCLQGLLREESRGVGIGPALPWILGVAVAARVAALLAGGAASVLRRVDRRAHASGLSGVSETWLAVAGGAAVLAAAATLVYLFAPRVSAPAAGGCCLAVLGASAGISPTAGVATAGERAFWTAAFLASGAAAFAAAWAAGRNGRPRAPSAATLAGASVAATVAGGAFLASALSPARLGLPYHECAACLLQAAPELWVGVILLLAGVACSFWALLASRVSSRRGLAAEAAPSTKHLLGFARFAYAASLAMAVSARWWA